MSRGQEAPQADGSGAGAAAYPRQWRRFRYPDSVIQFGALLLVLVFLVYSVDYLGIPLDRFLNMFGRLGELLSERYYPPDIAYVLDRGYLVSVREIEQRSGLELFPAFTTAEQDAIEMVALTPQEWDALAPDRACVSVR